MKLRKSDQVFDKEEKRQSEMISRRMRKGEYKNLILKILSEELKEWYQARVKFSIVRGKNKCSKSERGVERKKEVIWVKQSFR